MSTQLEQMYVIYRGVSIKSIHIRLIIHPFSGLFAGRTWVSWHQKDKLLCILMK